MGGILGKRRTGAGMMMAAVMASTMPCAAAQQETYGPPSPPTDGASDLLQLAPGIDPELNDAAAHALGNYPALAAARSNVRAADYEIEAAKWLRFPSVEASIATSDDQLGELRPDINIFQPIWTGGRISAAIERSRALRAVADAQLVVTSYDILERLIRAYYEIGRTSRLAAIYQESVAEHRRLVESMQRRVDSEVSPRTDLELAQTRASQAEQELAQVTTMEKIARRRFAELGGVATIDVAPPAYDDVRHHAVGDQAIERAGLCNPVVQKLLAEVALAEAERKLSKAEIMPQLGAQYVRDLFGGDQIGLALRAQTNGGLSGFSMAEAANARRDASQYAASTAQLEIREQVSLDLIENQSARARITSGSAAAHSSLNVTRSYLRQFVAGRRTWLDVMNSVREAVTARAALVEAETSAMTSSARIHLRSCEWLPTASAGGVE